jgi:hypothetical protein
MLRIPRRYAHFVFAVIQSGLTCFVASGIASAPFLQSGGFVHHWMVAWLIAWVTMLPIVLLAAPVISAFVRKLTRDE